MKKKKQTPLSQMAVHSRLKLAKSVQPSGLPHSSGDWKEWKDWEGGDLLVEKYDQQASSYIYLLFRGLTNFCRLLFFVYGLHDLIVNTRSTTCTSPSGQVRDFSKLLEKHQQNNNTTTPSNSTLSRFGCGSRPSTLVNTQCSPGTKLYSRVSNRPKKLALRLVRHHYKERTKTIENSKLNKKPEIQKQKRKHLKEQ